MNVGKHLRPEQHAEAVRLLARIQDDLRRVSELVGRAPYTDRTPYAAGVVQEWLIDPLRGAWDATVDADANPYPNVGYGGPHRRSKPPA